MTTPSDPAALPPQAELSTRRLHPASPVATSAAAGRQVLIIAVFVMIGSGHALLLGSLALAFAAVIVGIGYIGWYRFSYGIVDGVLRVDQGILTRNRREVPLSRIQQVDVERRLIHRMLGLAVIKVDTAGRGGDDAEIVLNALGGDDAAALRMLLLSRRREADPTLMPGSVPSPEQSRPAPDRSSAGAQFPPPPPPAATPDLVVHLTTRQLVIAGVTGRHLGAVLVFVGAVYGFLGYLPTRTVNSTAETTWGWIIGSAVLGVVVAVVVVAIWVVAAAVASVVQDHDYTLVRDGPDLHMGRGLLQQREATVALHRVQAVRITANALRRRLGLVAVQIQSGGGGSQAGGQVSKLTIPILPIGDLERILSLVSPGAPADPVLTGNPRATRTRWRFRAATPVVVVVGAAAVIAMNAVVLFGLLGVVPALIWADRYYRSLGHSVTATHVVSRWGAVFRHTAVMPVAKVQGCHLAASPFQRRVGLATLRIAVAGDRTGVPVSDAAVERLETVRHDLLASRASRLDEQATRRRLAAQHDAS